jgi:hypothetical protein
VRSPPVDRMPLARIRRRHPDRRRRGGERRCPSRCPRCCMCPRAGLGEPSAASAECRRRHGASPFQSTPSPGRWRTRGRRSEGAARTGSE